uniref:Uncharacterized protein n=1 Tax=Triticum urartu TaxID=4572 RepID=A0A8R7PXZ3_TRIUA
MSDESQKRSSPLFSEPKKQKNKMVAFATRATSLCLVLVPLLRINDGSESCPSCESQIDRGSSKIPLPVLSWMALSAPSSNFLEFFFIIDDSVTIY